VKALKCKNDTARFKFLNIRLLDAYSVCANSKNNVTSLNSVTCLAPSKTVFRDNTIRYTNFVFRNWEAIKRGTQCFNFNTTSGVWVGRRRLRLLPLFEPSMKLKVKVKLSLCFNWAPWHEGLLGDRRYSSTHSMTSALDGGEWLASRHGRFTPRERAPVTHWIGGWVGPRAVLDAVVKRKNISPRRESNPRTPIVQPLVQRYTDWAITGLVLKLMVIILNTYKMHIKFVQNKTKKCSQLTELRNR
jgi:hypothetical protein